MISCFLPVSTLCFDLIIWNSLAIPGLTIVVYPLYYLNVVTTISIGTLLSDGRTSTLDPHA